MSHARLKVFAAFALVAVCWAILPGSASAITQITNTAFVDYQNEVGTAQTTAVGTTTYAAESDPLLSVVKTRMVGSGPSGTMETFVITVTYPKISDVEGVCGDDSDAINVVVTDEIPAGFTFVPGSLALSTNGGSVTAYMSDAQDADAGDYNETTAGAITMNLGTMTEGTGDDACAVDTERVVFFWATKD